MWYFGVARLGFFVVLVICIGCAGQGSLGNGTRTAQPGERLKTSPSSEESAFAAVNKADQILDLRVDDSPDFTLVRITGNASLPDYQFLRSGENKFVLELNDINSGGALQLLPISSEYLTLSDGGMVSPRTIQLVGTLQKPLDYYVLNNVGNELVLALYLSKEARVSPEKQRVEDRSTTKASKKADSRNLSKAEKSDPVPVSDDVASQLKAGPTRIPGGVQRLSNLGIPAPGSRMQNEISKKQYSGKPISLDLLDADLKNVLRLISDITGTNMVIEPDVAGRVTIKVEKVPWDQVLDMVLAMNDLGKEEIGNVIRIARLSKLKQEWGQQIEQIRAKQELLEVAKDVGVISTAYLTVNYAQPVEIAAKISEVKSDRGKVSVDERSSLVIYTDYPSRIESARSLLGRLDRATSQVLIEARIVTANRDATTAFGTKWNLRFQKSNLPLLPGTPPAGTRTYQVNHPLDPLLGFTIADVIGDTLASIDFQLSALETANQVNIVAAPKVLTINNVKAVIAQGQQIPYLVRSDYGSSSTQFKDAVVELQVIPHITPDQKVRLEIQAKQDEPTVQNFQVGDSSVPGIDTRKITTELLVDDGKVVVIGGVMRKRDEEGSTGTPGLRNIPLFGWLFKDQTTRQTKTELLIFISPQIVDPTGLRPRS